MTVDLFQELQSALSHGYTIEKELGRGGNAAVYLAHDKRHDRKVALKVLRSERAHAVRSERFVREIQIASRLTHPHILPLYDSGEIGEILYYVMPLVDGESLRDRLDRGGTLPIDEAVRLAAEVAEALAYAHREGIVHRDIKPANILLNDGHALVADFGVARALTVARAQLNADTTVAGTPAYMSPEQAGGEEVDGRSDIYSLGCTLYEMLAGHPPFAGATAQEVLARHALDSVPSLRPARRAVTSRLQRAVDKALAKQPVDRYSTATHFAKALEDATSHRILGGRGSVAAAIILLLVGGPVVVWLWPDSLPRVLAVLECKNLGQDSTDDYFSQGMSEDLIQALYRIDSLKVIAPTSSFALRESRNPFREARSALKATMVVDCTVRRAGSRLSLGARLVNTRDESVLWSETYDRDLAGLADLVGVQSQIVRAIAGALNMELRGAGSVMRPSPANVQANELYLKGRYYWRRRSPDDLRNAVTQFDAAIAQDPQYAPAYSGLADTYVLLGQYLFMPQDTAYKLAKAASLRALALDETLSEAHVSFGRVLQNVDGDLPRAEQEYQHAILLSPGNAQAHSWLGLLVGRDLGRPPEGVVSARKGQALDPLAPGTNDILAIVLGLDRQHEAAIRYARSAIKLEPAFPTPHQVLARALLRLGKFDQAVVEFEIARKLGLSGANTLSGLAYSYGRLGNRAQAHAVLSELERLPRVSEWIALVHEGLGDRSKALDFLEKAVGEGRPRLPAFLRTDPSFDPFRSEPRFLRVLETVRVQGDSVP